MENATGIYCLDQNDAIYEYSLRFLFCKNFAYTTQLNEFILMASRGGLIEKWLNHRPTKFNLNDIESMEKICLKHFILTFCVLSLLSLVACSTFIFEHITYKRARGQRNKLLWTWAEILIDPDRHFLLNNLSYR